MTARTHSLYLASEEETAALARELAVFVAPGRVILLEGDIGAGKTHFARALIQEILGPLDVPSPTYTLVQTYPAPRAEIWHADLYRIGNPDECIELGLTDAFESTFCLIEWPDRLGDLKPDAALHITFSIPKTGEGRSVALCWTDPIWDEVFDDA